MPDKKQQTSFSLIQDISSLEELLVKELLFSKSSVKKYLSKNQMSHSFSKGDVVHLPVDLMNRGCINPNYSEEDLEVINEDDNFIAINKNSSLHGHPLEYSEENSVLNFLRNKYSFEHLAFKQESPESTLLYRLDFETSGVLIFAKNEKAYKSIRENFNSIVKEKIYHLLVKGDFDQDGVHRHTLTPSGKKGSVMKAQIEGENPVQIEVSKLQYDQAKDVSTLEVKLGRGARHQIRSQMQALGHPIIGDELYGGEKSSRLFLHAYKYSFETSEYSFSATAKNELFFDLSHLNSGL